MSSTRRGRNAGRHAVVAVAVAVVALVGCSDPEQEGIVTPPGGQTGADGPAEPGVDPALGAERLLAELREHTGYDQPGVVESGGDGAATLWVHVDPDDEAWLADRLDGADLQGLEVVATQPTGRLAGTAADARRFTTDEVRTFRDAVAQVLSDLNEELAEGTAEHPDSYPTTASVVVEYEVVEETLIVAVLAAFDQLPTHAEAQLREAVPAEVLDLRYDARD